MTKQQRLYKAAVARKTAGLGDYELILDLPGTIRGLEALIHIYGVSFYRRGTAEHFRTLNARYPDGTLRHHIFRINGQYPWSDSWCCHAVVLLRVMNALSTTQEA